MYLSTDACSTQSQNGQEGFVGRITSRICPWMNIQNTKSGMHPVILSFPTSRSAHRGMLTAFEEVCKLEHYKGFFSVHDTCMIYLQISQAHMYFGSEDGYVEEHCMKTYIYKFM